MSDEALSKDDPNYGTVDDPGFEDPYAHLRNKAKEQGTDETDTETTSPVTDSKAIDSPATDADTPPPGAGDQSGA